MEIGAEHKIDPLAQRNAQVTQGSVDPSPPIGGFSGTEIPRFYVCLSTQGYALLSCLLLLSSTSACSASLGFKLPVCGNQCGLILEHSYKLYYKETQ